MTTTRIYHVRPKLPGDGARLVRATNAAQALRHVVTDTLIVELASQEDLVRLLGAGVEVEAVNSEDEPANPAN